MASIIDEGGGRRRIEFFNPQGQRKRVRLGVATKHDAKEMLRWINQLLSAKFQNTAVDPDTARWLGDLPDKTHDRLARAGLVSPRGMSAATLGAFLDKFFAQLTGKPLTLITYGNVRRNLVDYFGAGRTLREIGAAEADAWRAWLVEHEEKGEDGKARVKRLATATVSRRVVAARTMWGKAMRWGLVTSNPFTGVKSGSQSNEARKAFVPREIIDRLIEDAPDTEWKAILALARYAGLRVPSELFALRWADVDFERGRVTITSPKTAHHAGHECRVIPLFAELRPHLEALFSEAAAEGAVYVVTKHRLMGGNLRQQMERFIARAGLTPWPRLFHNLRASRESELMREYDLATVCKWIGNSPAIAAKHYATSVDLDADFLRAAGRPAKAAQNAAQQGVRSNEGECSSTGAVDADSPKKEVECTELHSTSSPYISLNGLGGTRTHTL